MKPLLETKIVGKKKSRHPDIPPQEFKEQAKSGRKLTARLGNTIVFFSEAYGDMLCVDLERILMPPSGLYPEARPITFYPAVVETVVKISNSLAERSIETKSVVKFLYSRLQFNIRIIQYGWMNGIYHPNAWKMDDFTLFLNKYNTGGWAYVFGTNSKNVYMHDKGEILGIPGRIDVSPSGKGIRASKKETLALEDTQTIAGILPNEELQGRPPEKTKRYTYGTMMVFIIACNDFADGANLSYKPFPAAKKIAMELGRASRRSETVSAKNLASLMQTSYVFYIKIREPLLATLQLQSKIFLQNPEFKLIDAASLLLASPELHSLLSVAPIATHKELNSGTQIFNIIYAILNAFHAASFYMVGFMNARRPDELVHKTVGVRDSDIVCISAQQDLYRVFFYIEKGAKIRVPYFVNKLTYQILNDLLKISICGTETKISKSVFSYIDYRERPHYVGHFAARGNNPKTGNLARRAALENLCPAYARPHEPRSMRRGYAMMYQYRYIYPSIPALQQQLGHQRAQETFAYITNACEPVDKIEELFGPLDAFQQAGYANDLQELAEELEVVGHERLIELVQLVIEDDPTVVGGFSKIIRRYHRSMLSHVSYAEMDNLRKARAIAQALKRRGHAVEAKSDGDCWRGISNSRHLGRCQEPGAVGARHENATAELCNSCAFHTSFNEHTANLIADEAGLIQRLEKLPPHTLLASQLQKSLSAVRRVIQIRCETRGRGIG